MPVVSLARRHRPLRRRVLAVLGEQGIAVVGDEEQGEVEVLPLGPAVSGEAEAAGRDGRGLPRVAVVDAPATPRAVRWLTSRFEGIVLTRELERTLAPTLAAVHAGQCATPHGMSRLAEMRPLSPREKQILAMVVLGHSNAEIARKLVLTESTVKGHLSSSFAKLGVRSRTAATQLILDPEGGLGLGVLRISAEEDAAG